MHDVNPLMVALLNLLAILVPALLIAFVGVVVILVLR